jgi:predicted O-methyltransferase YrrM
MAMANTINLLKRTPVLGQLAIFGFRLYIISRHLFRQSVHCITWLFHSSETTNLTYDISPLSKRQLAATLSHVTGEPVDRIYSYFAELEDDALLRAHVRDLTRMSAHRVVADTVARYGRRIGWYALVRALKPRVVVETGVDKGLGACVIAAALKRNDGEGFRGRYFGTDVNPDAGYLLRGAYEEYGEILYGDSVEQLKELDLEIDMFINDSDHSADYEAAEYRAIKQKLSPKAILLGDNAHVTDKLLEFAGDTGRDFLFFAEKPAGHWYPGAGIGIAFSRAEPAEKPAAADRGEQIHPAGGESGFGTSPAAFSGR